MDYVELRKDLKFSYWIFAWFLLFYFKIIPYNPKIFLIIAFCSNCIDWILHLVYLHPLKNLYWYFIRTIYLKIIPLFLIWESKSNKYDIVFGIGLFLVYLAYVFVCYGSIEKMIEIFKNTANHNNISNPGSSIGL
jgi:hypothetical protein